MAIPGTVTVTSYIAPTSTGDTYPVVNPIYGLGGLRTVADTTERDAISTQRREPGMIVFVSGATTYYSLGSGLTNSDWTIFSSGSGSGNFLNISGGTVTGQTLFNAGLLANTFSATTITGQTIYANSLTATTLSGGTILSGSTNLYDIFTTGAHTKVQNGLNTYTGGTASAPTVNISAATLSTLNVSGATSLATLSATTMISGSTDLYNVFMPIDASFVSGSGTLGTIPLWNGTSVIIDSIIQQPTFSGIVVNGSVSIIGNLDVLGTATTINTQTIQSEDNNILLNYSGNHISAIGGGITVLSGQTGGNPSLWITDSNGNWSANTQIIAGGGLNVNTGTTLSSGGTDLYNIFTTLAGSGVQSVGQGSNITTGGTVTYPIINTVASPSFNNITFSGTALGGDLSATTISATTISATTINSTTIYSTGLSATTLSGGTILSGSTNLYDIFLSSSASGTSGNLWSASTGTNSIIANNGTGNLASGNYSIAGGDLNITSGNYSFIGNGYSGNVISNYAVLVGGIYNSVSGNSSFIGAGRSNKTVGPYSSIVGGFNNKTYGFNSFIGAGQNNITNGNNSILVGGFTNTLNGLYGTIVGGLYNVVSAPYAFIGGGGGSNLASGNYSTIVGGILNSATTGNATVIGGRHNIATAQYSTIINGSGNTISGIRSTIIGGRNITGTSNDTVYVPFFNIQSTSTNNVLTNILVRDSNGDIYLRDASTLGSGATASTGNFLAISGGTVTGDTIFTTNVSASTLTLTTTNVAAPLNFPIFTSDPASPINGDAWILSGNTGNALFSIRIGGVTKTVELT